MVGRGLDFREDASNEVNDVVRNRLRNEALPLLQEISGRDVVEMLVRGLKTAEDGRGIVNWAMAGVDAVDPQGRLHRGVLDGLPGVLQREVFWRYLIEKGVEGLSQGLIDRCQDMLRDDGVDVVNLPGGNRLKRRAGRIFIEGC